jgi:hypothetical protein
MGEEVQGRNLEQGKENVAALEMVAKKGFPSQQFPFWTIFYWPIAHCEDRVKIWTAKKTVF